MRPDNPATRECKSGMGGLHYWQITDDGARCLNCPVKLDVKQAQDYFFGYEVYEKAKDRDELAVRPSGILETARRSRSSTWRPTTSSAASG